MDVVDLRAFAALAREGRFTRAAEILGVSQPTLSRNVQRLEREVRSKVVVRAPHGVVLTEAGQRLLPHVERALAAIDSGLSEIAELAGEPTGVVEIGALPTVAAYFLPDVVRTFHAKHPDVALHVHEGFTTALEDRVLRGELDLAVVVSPVRHEELAATRLWREDHVVAVPYSHRYARRRKALPLAQLVEEPFVVIPGTPAMRAMEAICQSAGKRPIVALETENLESVRRMVESGLGIALVPRLMTRGRRDWRANLIPIADPPFREIAVVHRGAGYLTGAARALRTAIVEHVRVRSGRASRGSS